MLLISQIDLSLDNFLSKILSVGFLSEKARAISATSGRGGRTPLKFFKLNINLSGLWSKKSQRDSARFHHLKVFLCAIVRDNYCKIKHFIVEIWNFKSFFKEMSKVREKKCDAIREFLKFRGHYSTLKNSIK